MQWITVSVNTTVATLTAVMFALVLLVSLCPQTIIAVLVRDLLFSLFVLLARSRETRSYLSVLITQLL